MTTSPRAVVWDWNGTLLDDAAAGLATMNLVLAESGLPAIDGMDAYRRDFVFPVRDFYRTVGFDDDEAFGAASHRYLELFGGQVAGSALAPGAREAVEELAAAGLRQVLVSATMEDALAAQMAPHGLDDCFEAVVGITSGAQNPSKLTAVAGWLRGSGLDAHEVVLVGDTNHDEQVAAALGCRFIRYDGGHQALPVRTPWPVARTLAEVPRLVLGD